MFAISSRCWCALALASTLATAVACHSDATSPAGPTVAAVAGAYTLSSVSGQPLPTAVVGTSTIVKVSQATRTLRSDGTCSDTGSFQTYWGHGPPGPDAFTGTAMTCTWTLSGRTVTVHVVSNNLPYGGYAETTTATYADDGTLTETSADENGLYLYPRVYHR